MRIVSGHVPETSCHYKRKPQWGTEFLMFWRKGNWEAQTAQCCLEAEFIGYAKIWTLLPTHLDIALSRMSRLLVSNICPYEAAKMHHHNPIGSYINKGGSGIRSKLPCILSGMSSCTNASLKIRKNLSVFLLAGFTGILSGDKEAQNANAAG